MARKVRIQRKKKPFLHTKTKQLFAFGDLCVGVLGMFATYSGNAGREAYEDARTERTQMDVYLKVARIAHVQAQTERTHLLNQQTRAALAILEDPRQTASGIQQECPRCQGLVDIPKTNKTLVSITCPHCRQEWEIYPQGAEVMA